MRVFSSFMGFVLVGISLAAPLQAQESKPAVAAPINPDAVMLRKIHDAALSGAPAHEQLCELTAKFPGRLSGSKNLAGAVIWAKSVLEQTGVDRIELQPVMVPHWERGAPESVQLILGHDEPLPLSATALGGSVPTPTDGLRGAVVKLVSLDALKTTDVRGKIVFFNRPMRAQEITPAAAYGGAGDQRNRGPAEAAKFGAIGVLTRSLTQSLDDIPHTGNTTYLPDVPRIPAAALSALAADRLDAALRADPTAQVELKIHSQWFPDAPSHNVIAEIKGSENPEKIILVGAHLDTWDITPGAHDDGAGVVQAIEVLRLFRAIGYQPRHTIRCVLFANEENGTRGAIEYARVSGEKNEEHLLALESDGGGFQPRAIQLGNTAGTAATRAARWLNLFEPYGRLDIRNGKGGTDVMPLLAKGYAVGELVNESQRYFDLHHSRADTIEQVNPRELQLGAAAMASFVFLVDQYGL